MDAIRTVGHGTLSAGDFSELVESGGTETLVDVRRYPGSRRHPHFSEGAMAQWLPEAGIAYLHIGALGGRRRPAPDSPNNAWRNEQFAAYADHMASDEFAEGIAELVDVAERSPSAIMCSESVWWRCHRRMVADHLVLVEGLAVEHLFHDGRLVAHEPMAEAVVVGSHLEYPQDSAQLGLPIE